MFNNTIIEHCYSSNHIIRDLLIFTETARRNNGYYPQDEEVIEEYFLTLAFNQKILVMNKTSDYLDYDVALNKGLKLLNDKKMCVIGFYIIFSINTGLRVSDTLKIKNSSLSDDKLFLKEKKTKKAREISLNKVVKSSYETMLATLDIKNVNIDENYIFVSQKGTVYRTQSINVILKTLFNSKRFQISSHSLRKAFARKVYENMNESENALVLLSDIFNHSNIAITRRYLGIRQETIDNIYLTLE